MNMMGFNRFNKKRSNRLFGCLVIMLAAVLCFAGCNAGSGAENGLPEGSSDGASDGAAQTTEETVDTTDQPRHLKIGFIYSSGVGTGDELVTAFEEARDDVQRLLGAETGYMEYVLTQQFRQAVEVFRSEGYNVIVAAHNRYAAICDRMAAEETQGMLYINFGTANATANESALQPAVYEAANICGTVAAFNTSSNKIGIVADNNLFHAYGVADAFSLGVLDVPLQYSQVQVSLAWALSDSQTDTKNAVDSLIADGCDVIFLYQSSTYGISYCESLGVRVMGFADNIEELAPNSHVLGYHLNVSGYIVSRMQKARRDSFDIDHNTDGLKYGMVGMSPLNTAAVREGTQDILQAQYDYITEGKNLIFVGEVKDTAGTVRIDKAVSLTTSGIYDITWLEGHIAGEDNFSPQRSESDLVLSDLTIYIDADEE
jgi:basic membrane lipoprotein Med (substrate-binding protein (PBP1-ABC) superfamily)